MYVTEGHLTRYPCGEAFSYDICGRLMSSMMREALRSRAGFAVPQPFVEIATKFAERAGNIEEGLALLEDVLPLSICHVVEDRYETMPIEFFPFLATGGDGHCYGYVVHAPELGPDDYPMGSMVPGERDGVIFAGNTTIAAIENMISYMHSWPDRFHNIDLPWLATIGLHPNPAKAQYARWHTGTEYTRPSPPLPDGWRHVMTRDGIGVVAPASAFSGEGAAELPEGTSLTQYIAAADAKAAAGHCGSALCHLKEAWWRWYFSPDADIRQVKQRLVETYHKLGKALLADAMNEYYTWLR